MYFAETPEKDSAVIYFTKKACLQPSRISMMERFSRFRF